MYRFKVSVEKARQDPLVTQLLDGFDFLYAFTWGAILPSFSHWVMYPCRGGIYLTVVTFLMGSGTPIEDGWDQPGRMEDIHPLP
jgi:hypothetical protein